MSGDKAQFLSLQMKKGGRVTIGDSKTLQILGKGKIDTDPYVWHRRLGHAHMDLLNKLSKKKLVRGLPKIKTKDAAFNEFEKLIKLLENKLNTKLVGIRSDRGGEFQKDFVTYCEERGISHEFSAPRTPQQNGVVERKNRSLQETARTLLQESKLPRSFWAEAVNTACYVLNRVLIRPILDKTPYELLKKKRPNISYFRIFGSKCFVLKTIGNDGKFDAKSYEAIFLGYSMNSKTYRVYNLSKHIVEESIDVTFQEPNNDLPRDEEDDAGNQQAEPSTPVDDAIVKMAKMTLDGPRGNRAKDKMPIYDGEDLAPPSKIRKTSHEDIAKHSLPKATRTVKNHPPEQVIGDISDGLKTRKGTANFCAYAAFLAQEEPKNIKEALEDENWITAMQEELNQFERSRLVAQGYNQQEGIDFDQTYAPVARLESIRMLLAYACYKKIKLHQMDVKSAFLNGFLEEEVYVKQPPGFEHEQHPDYVYKLKKALYGLKQAPRAWYKRLSKFLIKNGFIRGKIDPTLFTKQNGNDILIVQIYVDDIIFGSTNDSMCEWFSKCLSSEFDMSMMGELNYFLGL
ncbi:hypothetical protein AgCh_022311 [Apium graveolens]